MDSLGLKQDFCYPALRFFRPYTLRMVGFRLELHLFGDEIGQSVLRHEHLRGLFRA